MKNTLKYMAALVACSAATLMFGLNANAQNLKVGTYEESNGIAYAKFANQEENSNKFLIDLKTFVTGEVTQTFEVHPADIVLVLDVSGSMTDNITGYVYNAANHTQITAGTNNWGYNNTKTTNYWYKYGEEYYAVNRGRGGAGTWGNPYHYFLFFTVNGTRFYINDSGQVVNNEPSNHTNANTDLWNSSVTLYTRTTTTTSKMDALKTAVKAFIDQIAHNDLYEDDTDSKPRENPLGNRISIVKFGLPAYNGRTDWPTSEADQLALLAAGDHYANYTYSGGTISNIRDYGAYSNGKANVSEVIATFTPTASTSDVTALKNTVNDLRAAGSTAADYGMKLAYELVRRIGEDRSDSRKTIVFFTDGEPNHSTGFVTSVANGALSNSHNLKAITYTETYIEDEQEKTRTVHPSVFSVGVFDDTPSSGSNLDNYMNYISSNYPEASSMTNAGSKDADTFYMDASGGSADDLKKIFEAIAHSAGGSGNTELAGGSAVTVDIVSNSFTAPKNSTDVTVLVAPCVGKATIDGKEYLTFGEPKVSTEYGLPAITVTVDPETNLVSTSNFDYSANWCGPDPTSTSQIQPGYHGFQQILQFEIETNDDAVGGPAVETNDEESGIYLDGSDKPLLAFNRPTVKLPVQIWLQKQGLRPGDSAVLTLYKSPFVENFDPEEAEWENFTKVVVSYEDMWKEVDEHGNPTGLVKIVGLDPDYFYKLKEDAWAFGYTYQAGGVQYTVGDNVQNPFIFVNTPKDVKYDEASLRNVFKEKTAASSSEE